MKSQKQQKMYRAIFSFLVLQFSSFLLLSQVTPDTAPAATTGASPGMDEYWYNPQKTFDERKALFLDYSSANAPRSGRTGIFAQVSRLAKGLPLDDYPRFDNPYSQTEFASEEIVIRKGDKELIIDFKNVKTAATWK